MAHFAKLDENNIVEIVIKVDNSDCLLNGVEDENTGVEFCNNLMPGIWKQTSYNDNFRKNFASIGFFYDEEKDAFIPPQPFNSWSLNQDTCQWEPPTPRPNDGNPYYWDENSLSWLIQSV